MGSVAKSRVNQCLATVGLYLINMSSGMSTGWSSPGWIKITKGEGPVEASTDEASWIVAMYDVGIPIGSVVSGLLVSTVGRRWCLTLAPVMCLLGNGLMFWGSTVVELCIARTLLGVSYGIDLTCCSLFIGEISSRDMRGKLCTLVTAMVFTGILLEFGVGPAVSYWNQILLAVPPPLISLVLFILWVPESPYYLASKGRTEEMYRALAKLRGTTNPNDTDVRKEGLQIKVALEEEKNKRLTWRQFVSSPGNRKGSGIVLFLCGTTSFLGVGPLMAYAQPIFEMTGSSVSSSASSIILCTVSLVVGLVSAAAIDRAGRRPLMLCTAVVDMLSMGAIGIYFFLKDYCNFDVYSFSWLPLVCLITFMIATNLGTTIVPWVLIGELLPTQSKAFIPSLAVIAHSVTAFVIVKLFPIVVDTLGAFVGFWFFTLWALVVFVFTYKLLPETRGKTLLEVQEMLHGASKRPDLTLGAHCESTVTVCAPDNDIVAA